MKKEKMTPEDFGSNLCDPDFLDEEGGLIPTSKNGRVKEMGDIKLSYSLDIKRGVLSVSFLKARNVVGAVSYASNKMLGFERNPRFYFRDTIDDKLFVSNRGQFIDHMIHTYPSTAAWILWNI